ncbi:hypothetical protein GCM10011375_39350 [Hymenobacter qilianensis]|uniref:Uncharacterized protein n=2 Tax=Hymenobacter qilianensis TaxID=1385715 RepID=A0ACB5PX52_9BACT|nr:hypothetical protein [Hymenobacter qilianensis]QNP54414.1 hypothetical protein H9L05_21815 [Hymenobacter qilianensis]GGF80374.1 hypothetical protein GCM10011375_39350 [Hymenobacter qilianensis]
MRPPKPGAWSPATRPARRYHNRDSGTVPLAAAGMALVKSLVQGLNGWVGRGWLSVRVNDDLTMA